MMHSRLRAEWERKTLPDESMPKAATLRLDVGSSCKFWTTCKPGGKPSRALAGREKADGCGPSLTAPSITGAPADWPLPLKVTKLSELPAPAELLRTCAAFRVSATAVIPATDAITRRA